mmetsp:Transcript_41364/g.61227  ORF Transcript_41364/g.61227 Transcript_41364/m.61227 type:complete len:449 (-) Transcript_41364:153-1499(-)|eukprot:CAMPEP_0194034676 /NCGR_PEP_ID=MMETSP0009_2-20130614/7097_1 /TAXON_ID=210454 /ORGANISM="Grammatophora oceanica, Strain CCMP 410" /LENGTH=448 /DNA_ID=CAMNT_0038675703 /DNA_START=131 /DNA_END=1477 /DNA_ORIENTATION=-
MTRSCRFTFLLPLALIASGCLHEVTAFLVQPSPSKAVGGRLLSPSPSDTLRKTALFLQGDFPEGRKELPYGEMSRRYRRTYYSQEDWVQHRAADRFLTNLLKTFRSGIVRELSTEIGAVAFVGLLACAYNAMFVVGWQDFNGVLHDPFHPLGPGFTFPQASLPTEPFSFSSSALGLLLVFRTNASYARWSEARQKWSAMLIHSRNLVRLSSAWMITDGMPVEQQKELLENLSKMTWAFARSLQRYLLGAEEDGIAYENDIRARLDPQVCDDLMRARKQPTRALYELTKAIEAIPMTEFRHVEVDQSAEYLCDALGGCERILSSPVPLVYTRHTARFLGFWILALPLAMWKAFGTSWNHLGLLPAACLISFFFFGIEELAIQLEEPFSILPLEDIVENIGASSDEVVEWHFEDVEREEAKKINGEGSKWILPRFAKAGTKEDNPLGSRP